MEMAELLQMGNYGVGGQYEPHWDHQAYPGSDNQWDADQGSRIVIVCPLFFPLTEN